MVLEAPVGYPLGYSINMLILLALGNSFGTWEVYLFGVSLDTLAGLMIGTGEGSLVGLSMGLPLGSPLESQNPGDEISSLFGSLTGKILVMPLENSIGYLLDSIYISIGVVLGLELGNYFDTSIGSLICYSADLEIVTLIGRLMGPLPENYLGRSLEEILGLTL